MDEIIAKRALGNGRWDRVLKARMVELSVADNYDDAKHEWVATGNIWHSREGIENAPEWVNNHAHYCLCRHPIVWHFEIHNTENDVRECVGSDHINTYMILREIVNRTGMSEENITDEMIQRWITERVDSMKHDWWWAEHGELFTEWFENIMELDLRVNVRLLHTTHFSHTLQRHVRNTRIRKRAEGKFGTPNYKMASIVWRWNHPNNAKAQINTRGYPNERLWNDLQMFYITRQTYLDRIAKQEEADNARLESIRVEKERVIEINKRLREEAKIRRDNLNIAEADEAGEMEKKRLDVILADRMILDSANEKFLEMCEFYDLPAFNPVQISNNEWERRFLIDVVSVLSRGKQLSSKQLNKLRQLVSDEPLPITNKQIWYITKLGKSKDYTFSEHELQNLNRIEASALIDKIKSGEFDGKIN